MTVFGYTTEQGATVVDFDAGTAEDFTGLTPELVSLGTRPVSQRDVDVKALRDAGEAESAAEDVRAESTVAARQSLTDAVQLAALSPYPTPEEQVIIDAQVSASLALFRALADPPADVTALAAAVLTLEVAR